MIVTILTLSSFCLPHCYPGFSCFHSLGENTHLASNHCHSSLVDSQTAILFYSTPFLIWCPNSHAFLCIVNHNPPAVITTSHVSKPSPTAFWFSFLSVFFLPSYYLPIFFCFPLTHRCTHIHINLNLLYLIPLHPKHYSWVNFYLIFSN